MNIADKFKEFYARKQLKKELANQLRTRKIIDFDEAKTIGVLYSIPDESTYKIITAFLKSLRGEQRTVIALGYINEKVLPSYLNQSIYNSLIFQKDLNWYNKPVNQYVNNFFKENFDIFLNISLEDSYPLIYIAAHVKAYLKAGRYNEKYTDCYDIMIKTDDNMSQKELLDNMMLYIRMLNNKN